MAYLLLNRIKPVQQYCSRKYKSLARILTNQARQFWVLSSFTKNELVECSRADQFGSKRLNFRALKSYSKFFMCEFISDILNQMQFVMKKRVDQPQTIC